MPVVLPSRRRSESFILFTNFGSQNRNDSPDEKCCHRLRCGTVGTKGAALEVAKAGDGESRQRGDLPSWQTACLRLSARVGGVGRQIGYEETLVARTPQSGTVGGGAAVEDSFADGRELNSFLMDPSRLQRYNSYATSTPTFFASLPDPSLSPSLSRL